MSDLWQISGFEVADAVRANHVSAVEMTQADLDRIADVNPAIDAVVRYLPEEVIAAAAAIDTQISDGRNPGPLCGGFITTKTNVDRRGHA